MGIPADRMSGIPPCSYCGKRETPPRIIADHREAMGQLHARIGCFQLLEGACSWCGTPRAEATRLIAGPNGVALCQRCVEYAYGMVKHDRRPHRAAHSVTGIGFFFNPETGHLQPTAPGWVMNPETGEIERADDRRRGE